MECLCKIKSVFKKIHEFEQQLQTGHNVTINEAMVICCLSESRKSSGGIAKDTEISLSRTSRVLLSLEQKGYIKRSLGDKDKRKMMFVLTPAGKMKLAEINSLHVSLPIEL
ncbi:MAG TPA: winged helix DNA-binding protein [Bacteroidales bacterium]|nr:winged helix DNA-binding protein [Bacteroidales bacterium]HPS26628.1 winged helix DNA-binding protein [Bacteroidales bacterium]